jgi:hypothetical protein
VLLASTELARLSVIAQIGKDGVPMLCHRVAFYRHGRASQELLHIHTYKADPSSWVVVSPRQHFRLLAACPGARCTLRAPHNTRYHITSSVGAPVRPCATNSTPRCEPVSTSRVLCALRSVLCTVGLNSCARRQAMTKTTEAGGAAVSRPGPFAWCGGRAGISQTATNTLKSGIARHCEWK